MNNGKGIVLNTPDFFNQQGLDAVKRIGSHLLVAVLYKDGVVFGNKFNKKQSKSQQWLCRIDDTLIIAGWGDWGHFNQLRLGVGAPIRSLKYWITDRYITADFLHTVLAPVLGENYKSSAPMAVDLLIVDADSKKLFIVRFDGSLIPKTDFGILCGMDYLDVEGLQKAQDKILKEHNLVFGGKVPNAVANLLFEAENKYWRSPLRESIAHLDKIYKGRSVLDNKAEAIEAAKIVLIEHDPPSKTEEFELTVFEEGKLESTYFKREKKISLPELANTDKEIKGK